MENEKILIIDGSSLLYRGFYALPLLANKKGVYTNGVYGFLTMLYRVLEEESPDYISVVFDKKGPTFRHDKFEDYKGHRESTPSELVQQFPIIREILTAMNIKYMEMSGYEADDIAGSLARLAGENSLETILLTGDKDYLQLADHKTWVYITRKGISNVEKYDRNRVVEEYGIEPDQLIDLIGLMGDPSDNIPGVPGIGEKTGLKLLKEYESIDGVYENLDKITGKKMKENLINNKDKAYLSRMLGEIVRNVPLDLDLEDLRVKNPKEEDLLKIYQELEFNSLISRHKTEDEEVEDYSYRLVSIEDLKSSIDSLDTLYFKTLINNNRPMAGEILAFGIKDNKGETLVHIIDDIEDFKKEIGPYLESHSLSKVSHNIKDHIVAFKNLGLETNSIIFDTEIAYYLLSPGQTSYSINDLGEAYIGAYGPREEALLGKGKGKKEFKDLDNDLIANYISYNLMAIEKSHGLMDKEIKDQGMEDLFYKVELPLAEVLANMEYLGFEVDTGELLSLKSEYEEEIDELTREIHDLAGSNFNINSPKQLGEVLFTDLGLTPIKKTKTGYSTNAEVLEKLRHEHLIIDKILRYRQIVKLKTTYIDGLLGLVNKETGRIHSTFNQTVTTTGRISSTEPNLQNIPIRTEDGRKIRKAFVAREGSSLVDADYSQIELRVLAHISNDPKLIEAFETGQDIHEKTAMEVFHVPKEEVDLDLRSRAKAVNFGIIYGISDYGLSRDLNIPRKESQTYIDNYFANYKMVKEYMDNIVKDGKEKGYVETILNRRRYIPELEAKNFNIRSFGERIAMNTPIQGSAADIIKIAMVKVYKRLKEEGLKSRLILQIHDELIIEALKEEVDQVKSILREEMESVVNLSVPLLVDIEEGKSWYETK